MSKCSNVIIHGGKCSASNKLCICIYVYVLHMANLYGTIMHVEKLIQEMQKSQKWILTGFLSYYLLHTNRVLSYYYNNSLCWDKRTAVGSKSVGSSVGCPLLYLLLLQILKPQEGATIDKLQNAMSS